MRPLSFALVFAVASLCLGIVAVERAEAASLSVSRAVIDFDENIGNRFALDNIIGDNTNISFDELGPTVADGLTIDGVTFGFQEAGIPSPDATFAAFDLGPIGPLTFLSGNIMEGSALGVLTLDFAIPTNFLSFGFAMNGTAPSPISGATVSLFDAANDLIGIFTVDIVETVQQLGFPEGRFEYRIAAVPVPAALPLFLAALGAFGLLRSRRH